LLTENPREGLSAWIVVDIDPEIAVQRLVDQRGMDERDARNRIASQPSREDRLSHATHVIHNDGDLDELRARVDDLWTNLLTLRAT
jgi:dephospho-CoA kinase